MVGIAIGSATQAAPIQYNFSVSNNWFNANPVFGTIFTPVLNGTITVDSLLNGPAAIQGFSLTTGTKTWTLADFVGNFYDYATFNDAGDLLTFAMDGFQDGTFKMYIYSNNTMLMTDGVTFNACNDCVAIGRPVENGVPEPVSIALLGFGLFGIAATRRRKFMQ